MKHQLYIDPGPAGTGWLVASGPVVIASGAERFRRSNALDWELHACDRFVRWAAEKLDQVKPDRLYCEQPALRTKMPVCSWTCWAFHHLGLLAHRRGIAWHPLNPISVKMHALGGARVPKKETVLAARRRGWEPRSIHEAITMFMHDMQTAEPTLELSP